MKMQEEDRMNRELRDLLGIKPHTGSIEFIDSRPGVVARSEQGPSILRRCCMNPVIVKTNQVVLDEGHPQTPKRSSSLTRMQHSVREDASNRLEVREKSMTLEWFRAQHC